MRRKRFARLAAGVVLVLLAALAPLVTASPANAASRHVGVSGWEARCQTGYAMCLYYEHTITTGAYWGALDNDPDLYDNYFKSGSGTGAGQVVKNNATAMACTSYSSQCFVYYNHGYTGNYDWAYRLEMGPLYYTWNNDASVEVISECPNYC